MVNTLSATDLGERMRIRLEDMHRNDLAMLAVPGDSPEGLCAREAQDTAGGAALVLQKQVLNSSIGGPADLVALAVAAFGAAHVRTACAGAIPSDADLERACATMAVWASRASGTPLTRFACAYTAALIERRAA